MYKTVGCELTSILSCRKPAIRKAVAPNIMPNVNLWIGLHMIKKNRSTCKNHWILGCYKKKKTETLSIKIQFNTVNQSTWRPYKCDLFKRINQVKIFRYYYIRVGLKYDSNAKHRYWKSKSTAPSNCCNDRKHSSCLWTLVTVTNIKCISENWLQSQELAAKLSTCFLFYRHCRCLVY